MFEFTLPTMDAVAEFIGLAGAFTYVFAYIQLQLKRDYAKTVTYSFMNFAAGCMALFSLSYTWNTGAVIGNIVWVVMSAYGMYRCFRRDNPEAVETFEEVADVVIPDVVSGAVVTVAEAVQDITPRPKNSPKRKKRARKKKKNRSSRGKK